MVPYWKRQGDEGKVHSSWPAPLKAAMLLLQEKETTVPTLSSRAVAQRLGSWEEAGITTESFTALPGKCLI